MKVLFWTLLIFFIAFSIHVVVWKIKLPQKQSLSLLKIFFATLATAFLVFWLLGPNVTLLNVNGPGNEREYLMIALGFLAFTLSYVITYSALEADSPSLYLALRIDKAAPTGITEEDIDRIMSNEKLVEPRIEDLIRDGLAVKDNERYRISKRGTYFISVFKAYRKLINAPLGG